LCFSRGITVVASAVARARVRYNSLVEAYAVDDCKPLPAAVGARGHAPAAHAPATPLADVFLARGRAEPPPAVGSAPVEPPHVLTSAGWGDGGDRERLSSRDERVQRGVSCPASASSSAALALSVAFSVFGGGFSLGATGRGASLRRGGRHPRADDHRRRAAGRRAHR
jgi:hypothetical protein